MTTAEIMAELERLGSPQTKETHRRHGAVEPYFGVKVGDMKPIVKKIKKNYGLAKQLYATGNSDAMYLAGLVADPARMTRADLQNWAETASWHMLSEYTVPWVTAESSYAWELARQWIDSADPKIAASGWATFCSYVMLTPDDRLDLPALEQLLERVSAQIHSAPNRVRYNMNNFVIAVGGSVPPLTERALGEAARIGKVQVDMGDTACKVPEAIPYIQKIIASGRHGKKRKTARC